MAAFAAFAAASAPTQAQAQGYPDFGVPAGWDMFGERVSCHLSPMREPGGRGYRGPTLTKRKDEPSRFQFQLMADMGEIGSDPALAFAIDGQAFPATYDSMGRAVLTPVSPAFERAFRRGKELTFTLNGREVYRLSLEGSAAAMRALDRCVAEVKIGPLPSVPTMMEVPNRAPPPPRRIPPPAPLAPPPPKPNVDTLARAPVPLNVGAWILEGDYPKSSLLAGEEGRVGYSLTVRKSGKVKRCTVTRSSGFPTLDDRACDRIKKNARFRPATDEKGKPVEGTYSGVIDWRI